MQNYELQGFLGEGAYGIVLKAYSRKTREVVAIKKFKDKDTENPVIKKVIVRELRALRALSHPNIVSLRDAFKQSERLFLVFEFCDQSLLDLQGKSAQNRLEVEKIGRFAREILAALAHMHGLGLVHRDVKPENILITQAGVAKLCDFGFARLLPKTAEVLTDYVATRWYRSPELLLCDRYGFPVDLWALGCVLGEAIDGLPLFPGENLLDQLSQIHKALGPLPESFRSLLFSHAELKPEMLAPMFKEPPKFNPKFLRDRYLSRCNSPPLVDLIERLLALDPADRPSAAQALEHPFFAPVTKKAKESHPEGRSSHPVTESRKAKELQPDIYRPAPELKTPVAPEAPSESRKHKELTKTTIDSKAIEISIESRKLKESQKENSKSHIEFKQILSDFVADPRKTRDAGRDSIKENLRDSIRENVKSLIDSKQLHREEKKLMLPRIKKFDTKKPVAFGFLKGSVVGGKAL